VTDRPSANPFIRYRHRLDSYTAARAAGRSDEEFVALVERIDAAVAKVAGHGFVTTTIRAVPELAGALGIDAALHVKDDTGNVGGSHKARHLFGVMLHLAVAGNREGELAIASCGNAAVAAATLARAVERPLRVFVPTWADPAVVGILQSLDARIEVSERRSGEAGDPTYLRFQEAVEGGSIPFSVQGTSTPTTLDGGRTIGWELADQLVDAPGRVRLFVQIGGGALASSAWMGLREGRPDTSAVLHAIQTEACAPLHRAWCRLTDDLGSATGTSLPDDGPSRASALRGRGARASALMAEDPGRYMWPWEPVGESTATGILDDVTYDWQTVVGPMVESGGWPIVVAENQILEANRLGRAHTGIDVDATGTAGLAGLLDPVTARTIEPDDLVVVLFTGVRREG
jgi:threonine synthase